MLSDLIGFAVLLAYYLLFLFLIPVVLKKCLGVPNELVRKIQHVGYSLSIFLLLELFSMWYLAVGAVLLLIILAYPFLFLVEETAWYKNSLVDRENKGGELRKQLIYAELTFAILIFLFWGLLGSNWHYVAAVAVMAWGFGDAAAALIGKAFGRRRFLHSLIDKGKTYEGTAAMILFAGIGVFISLLLYAGKPWHISLVISIIVAPICGLVELFSRRGADTFTVPLSAALFILTLDYLFTYLGW